MVVDGAVVGLETGGLVGVVDIWVVVEAGVLGLVVEVGAAVVVVVVEVDDVVDVVEALELQAVRSRITMIRSARGT